MTDIDQQVKSWRAHPHYRKTCSACGHPSVLHIQGEGRCCANVGTGNLKTKRIAGKRCKCRRFVLATAR